MAPVTESSTRDATAVLRMADVWKSFGGVAALKGVSFDVLPGTVHALLGENGAGKSTLMAIAAGAARPDTGHVMILDTAITHATPREVSDLGLATVYQHPAVLPDLTVRENLVLAMPPRLRPRWSQASAWAEDRLAVVNARIDPGRMGSDLTAAERQLVEIAKAVALKPRVLLLDEPTAVLSADQTDHLFGLVRRLRADGTGIVYISHRLPEIKQIADTATILRDGEDCGTFVLDEVSEADLLQVLTRGAAEVAPARAAREPGAAVLTVSHLAGGPLTDASFELRSHEIVGLGGVSGNGQSDALRALAGLNRHAGTVTVRGRQLPSAVPQAAQRAGVVYVPADRHGEGIFSSMSVRDNVTAQTIDAYATAGVINLAAERRATARALERLDVRAAGQEVDVKTLSGGNQQKVVLTRAFLAEPDVLLCEEPTQGVDPGARAEIHRELRDYADRGAAVAILSTDVHELAELCDRVLIFSRGQITQELTGADLTDASITRAAVTATVKQARREGRGGLWRDRVASLSRTRFVSPALLLALVVLMGVISTASNSAYLNSFNVNSVLFLASILLVVSMGELMVMLTGGVDFSVGPLMAVTIVVLSYFESGAGSPLRRVEGFVLILVIGVLAGLLHAILIRRLKIAPIIATVATYIGFQGLALVIRETPGGPVGSGFTSAVEKSIGFLPIVFVVAALLAVGGELMLRRSRFGVGLRAVGSDEQSAFRVGVRREVMIYAAYIACSVLAVLAGILLFAQVGEGDPTAGVNYSLDSVTAVVMGGASIYGGRGSFIGVAIGAVLLTQMLNVIPFLELNTAWQFWFPGILIILAGAAFGASSHDDEPRFGALHRFFETLRRIPAANRAGGVRRRV